jgi:DNA-directed RNA polymerase specialized sigma24 family protein
MDLEANASFDSNHGSTSSKHDTRKQQFTTKQRMDMYAFCVLELELHGNTVSIKKQQQAIQKALKNDGRQIKPKSQQTTTNSLSNNNEITGSVTVKDTHQCEQQQMYTGNNHTSQANIPMNNHQAIHDQVCTPANGQIATSESFPHQQHVHDHTDNPSSTTTTLMHNHSIDSSQQQNNANVQGVAHNGNNDSVISREEADEKKTLLQLQEEIAKTQRCYSDYQRTQVLTSSMLREVQRRFAKYYPDTPCPSRTTIKHVFMKCVENGTVENVKNPRKPTKIPNGDQIEQFLIQEPQMSLREMAKKLNVSTGTVSRRCRALGIVPESVTLKHQQMAMAKRQKQMKQLTSKTKSSGKRSSSDSSDQQQAGCSSPDQAQYANGVA